jgi:hypothetical protein
MTTLNPLQNHFYNHLLEEESRSDCSTTTFVSKPMMLPTEKNNSLPINPFLKIEEISQRNSTAKDSKKDDTECKLIHIV